jgi:hypothetical protein
MLIAVAAVTVKFTPLLTTPLIDTTTFPLAAPAGTGTTMLVSLQLFGRAAVPLNSTRLVRVPIVGPKFAPLIVTTVPTGPNAGFKLVILGGGVTVKAAPLLATPPTVTTTLPVVAPVGTGTSMLVALQFVGVATVLLKATVLVPCVAPKFVPVIVTVAPTGPWVMLSVDMLGVEETVKTTWLLLTPCTTSHRRSFPIAAPVGTGTVMLVSLQFVGVPAIPANETVLVPCDAPKNVPVIVTRVPEGPEVGFKAEMFGGLTVKNTLLLACPATVTTTFPFVAPAGTGATMLVALQLVGVSATPLNVTVLVP